MSQTIIRCFRAAPGALSDMHRAQRKDSGTVTTTLTAHPLEAADWLALARLDDDGAPPAREEAAIRPPEPPGKERHAQTGTAVPRADQAAALRRGESRSWTTAQPGREDVLGVQATAEPLPDAKAVISRG